MSASTNDNSQFGSSSVSEQTPKLPHHSDCYTKPTIQDLVAKERAEPGYCSRVKNFIFGRTGVGRIKFLGETDVRQVDLESCIRFLERKVILNKAKWPAGPGFINTAEITLINRKFCCKETGCRDTIIRRAKFYKKKSDDQGVKLVSYDPIKGEIKFRVKYASGSGVIQFYIPNYIPNASKSPRTRRSITRMMNEFSL